MNKKNNDKLEAVPTGSAITDTDMLNWLEKQIDPGCFYTLAYYEHASNFFCQAPKGWSKQTPIGLGEFPKHFGATLRDAISAAIRAESPNAQCERPSHEEEPR